MPPHLNLRLLTVCVSIFGASFLLAAPPAQKPDAPKVAADPAKVVPVFPPEDFSRFKLQPGFKIELVAAEPLIVHPVAGAFDADGRLWVVEMRAYMPDVYGTGETEPTGRISILEDTNGDGRMDKSTVFLDKLILPRAVGFCRDGVMVVSPPTLLFCRDKNGDGVSDEQVAIASDLGSHGDPEYKINGWMSALDNWTYCANYGARWRFLRGQWTKEAAPSRGQWGITHDDFGRFFYSTNASMLRVDPAPAGYFTRNPHHLSTTVNVQVTSDGKCFPAHHTIANRGSPDKLLSGTTSTCGTAIYRGDLMPELRGSAFICEPVGNLVKRILLSEKDGAITGKNAYDKQEFLTSTDERFRPVNVANGPDGALFIVDMHHGLIQHRAHLTEYARNGYLERGLDQHLDMGRIYRIVPDKAKASPAIKMAKMTALELAGQLGSPNGWRRDTAQRLLVDRADAAAVSALKQMAAAGPTALAKIHALWTLEGLEQQDAATLSAAMKDTEPTVRATAIRVSEPLLAKPATRANILASILKLAGDATHDVRLQLGATLSEVGTPEADLALINLLATSASDALVRDAVLSGLSGREIAFLDRLLAQPEWQKEGPGRAGVLAGLAACVFAEGEPKKIEKLLQLATTPIPWRQIALLDGAAAASKAKLLRKPVQLDIEPAPLLALMKIEKVRPNAEQAATFLIWPGKAGYVAPPPVVPLTAEQKVQFEEGRKVFGTTCAACHQANGKGLDGLAPPLVDSQWVLGSEKRLARIILSGLSGPITVNGQIFNLEMPGLGAALDDKQIAAALTYIRREWDHTAAPVTASTVAGVRKASGKHPQTYTAKELLGAKD